MVNFSTKQLRDRTFIHYALPIDFMPVCKPQPSGSLAQPEISRFIFQNSLKLKATTAATCKRLSNTPYHFLIQREKNILKPFFPLLEFQ